MFQIETAGLVIRIENRHPYLKMLCREYLTGDDRTAQITVSVTEEEIDRELKIAQFSFDGAEYAESAAVLKKISNALPAFDAFLMHSSVLEVDGWAYGFAAESGVGKSTHTRYWLGVLGERARVINGDKPFYRFLGGKLMAFGTPWCGKENWHSNASAPLKALCLLERGDVNSVSPQDGFAVLGELSRHFHLPGGEKLDMVKLMELIDRMVTSIPIYRLICRNDQTAAETAIDYFGLRGQ